MTVTPTQITKGFSRFVPQDTEFKVTPFSSWHFGIKGVWDAEKQREGRYLGL